MFTPSSPTRPHLSPTPPSLLHSPHQFPPHFVLTSHSRSSHSALHRLHYPLHPHSFHTRSAFTLDTLHPTHPLSASHRTHSFLSSQSLLSLPSHSALIPPSLRSHFALTLLLHFASFHTHSAVTPPSLTLHLTPHSLRAHRAHSAIHPRSALPPLSRSALTTHSFLIPPPPRRRPALTPAPSPLTPPHSTHIPHSALAPHSRHSQSTRTPRSLHPHPTVTLHIHSRSAITSPSSTLTLPHSSLTSIIAPHSSPHSCFITSHTTTE